MPFEAAPATPPRTGGTSSPGRIAWRRFRRDRAGIVSAYVVLLFFTAAIAAPLIAKLYGKDPYTTYGQNRPGLLNQFGFPVAPNGGVSGDFWFGVEPQLGRDVFTLLLYGIRNSLLIATVTTLLVTGLGIVVGVTAGYLGGRIDNVVGRIVDILLAFPSTLFFIAMWPVLLSILVPPDENTPTWLTVVSLISVMTAFGWAPIARLLRGEVLALREREFVEAAKVTGASAVRIVFRELLPNLWTPVLIQATLALPMYVTILGLDLGYLLGGAIITEETFGLHGIGALSIKAVRDNDLPLLLGVVLVAAAAIVVANIVVDAVYALIDPRVRLA